MLGSDLEVTTTKEKGHCQVYLQTNLLQVLVSVAPQPLLEQIEQRFFRNHLEWLATQPVANFVVQALLGSISKSPQVTLMKHILSLDIRIIVRAHSPCPFLGSSWNPQCTHQQQQVRSGTKLRMKGLSRSPFPAV